MSDYNNIRKDAYAETLYQPEYLQFFILPQQGQHEQERQREGKERCVRFSYSL